MNGRFENDQFGTSVSLSSDGSRIAIGAPLNDGNGMSSGQVRVFENLSPPGSGNDSSSWRQIGPDINGEEVGDWSGQSVSLSNDGTRVAIGAINNDGAGQSSGHVRVYDDTSVFWTQVGRDINGEAIGDLSGWSISLSGDGKRVAVGALSNEGSETGRVRVFEIENAAWTQIGQNIDEDFSGELSGISLSLSDDGSRIALGADNSSRVNIYDYTGSFWTQVGRHISSNTSNASSGLSVSLSGNGKFVAIGESGNGVGNSGQVRVFQYIRPLWTQVGQDIEGESSGDFSGNSVSISSNGQYIAIGASRNRFDRGHVRVYENKNDTWVQFGQDIDGSAVDDFSGCSVSLSSDGYRVAIGAFLNDDNGSGSGHARIYELNVLTTAPSAVPSPTFYSASAVPSVAKTPDRTTTSPSGSFPLGSTHTPSAMPSFIPPYSSQPISPIFTSNPSSNLKESSGFFSKVLKFLLNILIFVFHLSKL